MLGQAVLAAATAAGHKASPLATRVRTAVPLRPGVNVVINCAGIVKGREASPQEYVLVNGVLPWKLTEACDRIGARLIHVSTDCVFDGLPGPHAEGDPPAPIDLYGRSKLAGEVDRYPHLTVRTSFIGEGSRGLIAELRRCERSALPYLASANQLWTGHSVQWIAWLLVHLAGQPAVTGILHVPGLETNRLRLVADLRRELGIAFELQETETPKLDRSLISKRWSSALPDPPHWSDELECLRQNRSVW